MIAIVRQVSPTLANCELTFLSRQPIDIARAREQHESYTQWAAAQGAQVISLQVEPDLPDAVFVEDGAVVVDEVAVLVRMRSPTRQKEIGSIAAALSAYRPLKYLVPPATLDGGDVLRVGRTLYAGVSGRTNRQGISQLREILRPLGYEVREVDVTGCLHLKTGCSYLGRNTVLANPSWVDLSPFAGLEVIEVAATEPWAANCLTIGETMLLPRSFPQTRAILQDRGFRVQELDISELQKAEAGVTCLSIIFDDVV